MLVLDVSRALDLLHQAGLVHMDVREDNVVKLPPPDSHHMLIDLETVGTAGAPVSPDQPPLRAWNSSTLNAGCFSAKSDMYLLGLMMGRLLRGCQSTPLSERAQGLYRALISPAAVSCPSAADVCASVTGLLA